MYIYGLVLLAASLYTAYWYGKKSNPAEIVTKVEEKIVEKVVTVEVEKKNEKKNTTTVVIEHPDGTKETKVIEQTETNSESTSKKDTSKESEKVATNSNKQLNLSKYRLGATVESKVLDKTERDNLKYSATGSMRVLGPWWLDAKVGVSDKTLGLGLSLEF
jgi:hypothetical protein